MWLLLPAVISFFVKIGILVFARRTLSFGKPSILLGLLVICGLHNICEVLTYGSFLNGSDPGMLFRTYYLLLIFMFAYMFAYAIQVSQLKLRFLYQPLIVICIVIGGLFYTNMIVEGYTAIEYSITAIRGEHYWIFQLSALSLLFGTPIVLTVGYRRAQDQRVKVQCMYTILALAPLVFGIAFVILLMMAGIKINAMIVIPIATTLFIIVTVRTEAKHRMTDIRRWLPGSPERKAAMEMLEAASDYNLGDKNLKEALQTCEKVLVKYKFDLHRYPDADNPGKQVYNVSAAADDMGMSRSTAYLKAEQHGISVKRQKAADKKSGK